jgi:hypothetical protein
LFHAAFHDAELDGYDARHLNGATEGYLAVSLNVVSVKKNGPYIDIRSN